MIRINLIEGASSESQAKVAEVSPAFQATVFIGALLVAGLVVAGSYWFLDRQVTKLGQELEVEKREAARLASIQAQNLRHQAELEDVNRRISAIQALQDSRQGPTELMTLLGATVNRTSGLYLLSVAPKEGLLVVNGASSSVTAIADFVSALKTAGSFHDVNLREYFEDDREGQVSFKFSLDCVYEQGDASVTPAKTTSAPPRSASRGT